MRLLVLSDSHGNLSNMVQAVEQSAPRMILHLGDCWRDGEHLHDLFPELPFEQVPGNCDCRPGRTCGKAAYFGGSPHLDLPRPHIRRQAVPFKCRLRGAATTAGSVPLWSHAQAAGGPAGPDAVFEPRQHRRLPCPLLWSGHHRKRKAGRPHRASYLIKKRTPGGCAFSIRVRARRYRSVHRSFSAHPRKGSHYGPNSP